jgi:hypothetical protein
MECISILASDLTGLECGAPIVALRMGGRWLRNQSKAQAQTRANRIFRLARV